MIQRLSQLKSDLEYDGPAVYINIIGAGVEDDADFFRLYIGQALYLRKRVRQYHDQKYRRTHPPLQYHMIDCRKRPLVTFCMGTLPKLCVHRDGDTEFVLSILEKLGTLSFQTLSARLLAQFEVQAIYPNGHFNVLSPLFQFKDLDGSPNISKKRQLSFKKLITNKCWTTIGKRREGIHWRP